MKRGPGKKKVPNLYKFFQSTEHKAFFEVFCTIIILSHSFTLIKKKLPSTKKDMFGNFGSQPKQQAANPFAQSNPFAQPKQQAANPFAQPKQQAANPFAQPKQQAANPFANPFAQQKQQAANPFAQQQQPKANPFAQQPSQPAANPFAQQQQQQPKKEAGNPFAQAKKSETDAVETYEDIEDIKEKLYPSDYVPRRELMASLRAFYGDKQESYKLFDECAKVLNERIKDFPEDLKKIPIEYARAIICYTAEIETKPELSAYKLLNKALREKNFTELCKFRDLFYILLRSFRSLQSKKYEKLYRGMQNVPADYKVGDSVEWLGFSSASEDKKVAAKFSFDDVLFEIRNVNGYSLQNFSAYSEEKEVLLDLNTKFVVKEIKGKEKIKNIDEVEMRPTVIVLDCVQDSVPLKDFIDEVAKREPKGSLLINEHKGTYAVFLDDEEGDEWLPMVDGTGNPCVRNMRTGKIDWRSQQKPLPEGWAEEVDENGITYYINRAMRMKTYERPV